MSADSCRVHVVSSTVQLSLALYWQQPVIPVMLFFNTSAGVRPRLCCQPGIVSTGRLVFHLRIVSYNAEIKHIITISGSRRCFKGEFMLTLTPYVHYRGHA